MNMQFRSNIRNNYLVSVFRWFASTNPQELKTSKKSTLKHSQSVPDYFRIPLETLMDFQRINGIFHVVTLSNTVSHYFYRLLLLSKEADNVLVILLLFDFMYLLCICYHNT